LVGLSKRLWDIARSNATDFASELFSGEDGLTREEKAELDAELEETLGSKAGRQARQFKDAAEDAWDRAFDAAQAGGGPGTRGVSSAREREGWYRTLELEPGASYEEVRRSYRRLVAKYHPDRYASDPAKYEAATEVARKITLAHEGLKTHLEG
jgi:DnaJ-domain-containing protein 1